jgi:hypothetical protein
MPEYASARNALAEVGRESDVNEVFPSARERFSPKRKDGERATKGDAKAAAGVLWAMRHLKR